MPLGDSQMTALRGCALALGLGVAGMVLALIGVVHEERRYRR